MLIINKYTISTPAPALATNDADVNTGITGATWGGCNPAVATGATGNAAANDGLTNVTSVNVFAEQVISKIVQIKFAGALSAGVPNYVRVPLTQLGVTTNKPAIGCIPLGVFDENATENNNTPTPSLMQTGALLSTWVVKDCLQIKIPAANIALVQGKAVNILLIYT